MDSESHNEKNEAINKKRIFSQDLRRENKVLSKKETEETIRTSQYQKIHNKQAKRQTSREKVQLIWRKRNILNT